VDLQALPREVPEHGAPVPGQKRGTRIFVLIQPVPDGLQVRLPRLQVDQGVSPGEGRDGVPAPGAARRHEPLHEQGALDVDGDQFRARLHDQQDRPSGLVAGDGPDGLQPGARGLVEAVGRPVAPREILAQRRIVDEKLDELPAPGEQGAPRLGLEADVLALHRHGIVYVHIGVYGR